MEMSNGNSGHSHAEGLRVHHLANLGGLIAIAGLDLEPPDFLLGALLSLAQEAAKLSREQREQVASMGRSKLNERATGKRVWKSWNRARQLQAITLSTCQLRDIIEALGGEAPEDATQLPLALSQILTHVVVVGLIGEARTAVLIGAPHPRQINARGVRKVEPVPRHLCAALPVLRRVLIGADEAASLGNEDVLASRAVEYVLAYLGEDRSRQIRVDAADQNRGDHLSRHHRVGGGQRRGKRAASGYLPVALAENEISVSLIPLATRFDVWIRCHKTTPDARLSEHFLCPRIVRMLSENLAHSAPEDPK